LPGGKPGCIACSNGTSPLGLFHFIEKPGPRNVGLKVVEQYDYSRIYHPLTDDLGKPFQGRGSSPDGLRGPHLGEYNDLPTRFVLLHAAVRLNDLLKVKNFGDLDAQTAHCDLLDQFFERSPHKIFRFAGVAG
jgi:hypothetical protein